MEDTLGAVVAVLQAAEGVVLILVLMEDTLGDGTERALRHFNFGLNPCFNGRYSRSSDCRRPDHHGHRCVLILVLMEDTLGGISKMLRTPVSYVLILVLMEDTLGEC